MHRIAPPRRATQRVATQRFASRRLAAQRNATFLIIHLCAALRHASPLAAPPRNAAQRNSTQRLMRIGQTVVDMKNPDRRGIVTSISSGMVYVKDTATGARYAGVKASWRLLCYHNKSIDYLQRNNPFKGVPRSALDRVIRIAASMNLSVDECWKEIMRRAVAVGATWQEAVEAFEECR